MLTDGQKKSIKKLYKQGKSQAQISRALEIPPNEICLYLHNECGVKKGLKTDEVQNSYKTIKKMLNAKKTIREIAENLGITIPCVSMRLKKMRQLGEI